MTTVTPLYFARELAGVLDHAGLESDTWYIEEYPHDEDRLLVLHWAPRQLPKRWRRGGASLKMSARADGGWSWARTHATTGRRRGEWHTLPLMGSDPAAVASAIKTLIRTR